MANNKAPKQWSLGEIETITGFEAWKNNLLYVLGENAQFEPYLEEGVKWERTSNKAIANRGFTDDATGEKLKAKVKVKRLELMLGQIANYAPIYSRNTIVKNSRSLPEVFQALRSHYNFQTSGARFIDFLDVKLGDGERYETLFQKMTSFIEDNLLMTDGNLTHNGEKPTTDEEMTPTLENMIVLLWLHQIHPELPDEVRLRYGTELRNKTLASIKPEISHAIDSMLSKINDRSSEARVMATKSMKPRETRFSTQRPRNKVCSICKAAGRTNYDHFTSSCTFLLDHDRKYFQRKPRTRKIVVEVPYDSDDEGSEEEEEEVVSVNPAPVLSRRVKPQGSPSFRAFYKNKSVTLTIDTGAETNMIKTSVAQFLGIKFKKTNQTALQADGVTPLEVVGETKIFLTRNEVSLQLEALIVADLDVDILAGTPFMMANDIAVRPARYEITIKGSDIITYGQISSKSPHHAVRRAQAQVLKSSVQTNTIWPGDFMEFDVPAHFKNDDQLAIEPRQESKYS